MDVVDGLLYILFCLKFHPVYRNKIHLNRISSIYIENPGIFGRLEDNVRKLADIHVDN